MKLIVIPIFLTSVLLLFISCENESTCGGKAFRGNAEEEIYLISTADSVVVILEQAFSYPQNDSITSVSHFIKSDSNVIRLKLFVHYESYREIPHFYKDVDSYGDTIKIWFSIREQFNKLSKSSSIVGIECSPIIEFSIIDSVHVFRGANKFVNIIEKYSMSLQLISFQASCFL